MKVYIVSKENVVPRRWGSETLKFDKGLTLETSAVVQCLSLQWKLSTCLEPDFGKLNQ